MDNHHESAGHHRAGCYRPRARRPTPESDRLLVTPPGHQPTSPPKRPVEKPTKGPLATRAFVLSFRIPEIAVAIAAPLRPTRHASTATWIGTNPGSMKTMIRLSRSPPMPHRNRFGAFAADTNRPSRPLGGEALFCMYSAIRSNKHKLCGIGVTPVNRSEDDRSSDPCRFR
jgi:hypothetical protein